ncbi:MAG TPA: hypothetical protein VF388_08860, partial [Lacunisphaera sp.]
ETCPAWPDQTVVAHWSSPDPAEFRGDDAETFRYFTAVAAQIQQRIQIMCAIPLSSFDQARRERRVREIGNQAKLPEQL